MNSGLFIMTVLYSVRVGLLRVVSSRNCFNHGLFLAAGSSLLASAR
jgi:hypothetical protein